MKFVLISLLIVAWWTRVSAQDDDAPQLEPVILTDEKGEYPLGTQMDILEDPSGELTIEDVASPEFDSRFAPSQVEVPNYGFTDSAYWVRLNLLNEAPLNHHWLLGLGFANTQFVDLYAPLPDGGGFSVKQTGSLRPVSTRDVRYPRIVFELTLPSQEVQTYYLRFQSDASMTLALTLWSPGAFLAETQQDLLRYGIFFGLMFGLVGYNLFLFFSLREKNYLYLTIFLANWIFFEASYAGYEVVYFIPGLYFLKPFYQPLSFALIFISALFFSHSFLEIRSRIPKLHRVYIVIGGVWGGLIVLVPFTSYLTMAGFMVPWGLVSLVAVLASGVISWQRGYRPARFFMIAWLGLVVTVFITLLVRLGLASSTPFSENAYHIGVMWMGVFWSIALADRINQLKAETESANRDLQSSEHRLSQILEGLPLGVVVYGKDRKPSYTNRRVVEILGNPEQGIEPDLSAGRTLDQAMNYYSLQLADSDQDYPIKDMPVYRALQGEAASVDDIEADLVDRRVPLEVWASPVMDDAGRVEEAVVAFQDISTRKQAEKALLASENKFRVIVENNLEGIVFMAHDRQVLYVSPSYERLNGFNAKEMIGKSGVDFVHPDDRAHIAEVFGELLQRPGGKARAEYRTRHRDGSWFWVETNAVNLLDDPHVGAVLLNIRDITERKQTEATLADYQHHLESLVEERTEELSAANQRLGKEIVERELLEKLLYRHIEWLSTLSRVRQSIGGVADLPQAYDTLSATILQLLEAGVIFILNWDGKGKEGETTRYLNGNDQICDTERIALTLKNEASLREAIEVGQFLQFSADQTDSLPAPLGQCFQDDGFRSLVLAPMISYQTVSGVLGLASAQAVDDFTPAEVDLIQAITLDLAELEEDAQLLDQARALVAADERNRLARDLHDSVTQVLFSASLVAEVLPQIWRRDPDQALRSLEELRRLTRGALAEMRTMLLELRPTSVFKSPLAELLAQLTEAITSRAELPFKLFVEQIPPLPEEAHIGFYRIAQEALNNVVKHAQASQVSVSLSVMPLNPDSTGNARHEVKLVIRDDGVGFSPRERRSEHLGLGIMRERAAAIGADLSVESEPGKGTQVKLIWPNSAEDSG